MLSKNIRWKSIFGTYVLSCDFAYVHRGSHTVNIAVNIFSSSILQCGFRVTHLHEDCKVSACRIILYIILSSHMFTFFTYCPFCAFCLFLHHCFCLFQAPLAVCATASPSASVLSNLL